MSARFNHLLALAQGASSLTSVPFAIENWRKREHFSRKQMAALLGIDQTTYSSVIHGHVKLSFRATKRAYALGFPADILLQP